MKNHLGERFGNYRLISSLGSGGFAEVFLGEHIYLKTHNAIKIFYAPITDEDTIDFLKEARTIAALDHPNIIPVLDCGVERHIPFYVMKYASGGSVRRRHPKGSRVPPKTIVSYVKQIAAALQYAHHQKIIHRDVKPENMLLGHDDTIYLSDFGIALIAQTTQTTQDAIGTWAYMAPEQFAGKPRLASDQYSLGIVVYEWICGERPFQGTSLEIYGQHLNSPPPSLKEKVSDLPISVEQTVFKALEKEPKNRFASIQAFASALEHAYQPLLNNSHSFVAPTFPAQIKNRELTSLPPPLDQEVLSSKRNAEIIQPSQLTVAPPIGHLPLKKNEALQSQPLEAESKQAIAPMEELQPRPVVHAAPMHEEATSLEVRPGETHIAAFTIGKLNDFLQWLFVILEVSLLLRFILRLIGVNSANPFAGFLYALTGIVLYSFANIVESASIKPPDQAFEWSTLIAMLVYWLIFYAIRWFLRLISSESEE